MIFNVYIAIFILILACFGYVFFLNKIFQFEVYNLKYNTIEGLRGYLAYFVFIHHFFIWYFYLLYGEWKITDINIINHFGKTSVSFFFMITSFLFTNKLLEKKEINWFVFFNNRIKRLFPLYIFNVIIIFIIVMKISDFKINVPKLILFQEIFNWITFTYFEQPDINNIPTKIINAGVFWSLRYEWVYYFSLPFLYILITKRRISILNFIVFFILILLFFLSPINNFLLLFYNFIGGGAVAIILKNLKKIDIKKFTYPLYSFIAILLMIGIIFFFNSSENVISITIQIFVFAIIVSGNDFFKILVNKYSLILGQLSYSIYLSHGIVLYVFNSFVFSKVEIITRGLFYYLLLGLLYSFITILFSFLTHKYIEKPFMKKS